MCGDLPLAALPSLVNYCYMHREVMKADNYQHLKVHHKNENGLNNQKDNLEFVLRQSIVRYITDPHCPWLWLAKLL